MTTMQFMFLSMQQSQHLCNTIRVWISIFWLRDANGTLIDSSSSTNLIENVTSTGTLYAGGSTYYLHVDVWSFTTPNTGIYTLSYFIIGGSPPLPPAPGNVSTTLANNLTYGEHVLTNLTTNSSYSYEFDVITAELVNGNYTLFNATSTPLNVTQSNLQFPRPISVILSVQASSAYTVVFTRLQVKPLLDIE